MWWCRNGFKSRGRDGQRHRCLGCATACLPAVAPIRSGGEPRLAETMKLLALVIGQGNLQVMEERQHLGIVEI